MNKKLVRIFFIISVLTGELPELSAQQLPLYSQYMFNTLEINPTYAGFKQSIQFTSIFRKQFNGIKNSPQTAMIFWDMPIGETNLGVGLKIVDDRFSITKTYGAQGAISYKIEGDYSNLAFGLQVGALNYKADMTQLNVTNPGDPIFAQDVSTIVANFGTGIFYNTDKFYIGLSVPNLVRTHLKETNVALAQYDVKQSPHGYLNASTTVANLTATNTVNTAITDDVATVVPVYPTFVLGTSGNLNQRTASSRLSFVPSTGQLSASSFNGTWNGAIVAGQFGGTGVANTGRTIILGGNLTTFGANAIILTTSGPTNVTLPTSGTLVAAHLM